MSSNPAEGDAAKSASRRTSWSLTTRLAILTSISSFIILTAVSIQMYFMLVAHLRSQNVLFLRDEVETLTQLSRFIDFGERLANEMHVDPVGEEYIAHYVRLLDGEGRIIIETPNMGKMLPGTLFPPPRKNKEASEAVAIRGVNGASFVGASALLDTPFHRGSLQVALDVTNVEKVLVEYRIKLALALSAGLLLCAGAGMTIARRGARPIREISEKARTIRVDNLNERLSGPDWPIEVNAMADALNGMLDRLESSFTRLYNSVANLTHKLRTPLTIMSGEAEVALVRERTAEELREVIASSLEECGRLSHLVDNIIFISQVEAGKPLHVPMRFDAHAELDKVLEFYEPLAEEKGIRLTCEGDALLAADAAMLRRAVANVVSNALTFTSSGGTVKVSVRQDDGGSVEISIADTGCGIAEEELSKIFDRFYRVYATRFMEPHGSGLGLTLVKTIMDLHGGTIVIHSVPEQGTTVSLQFSPPVK